MNKNEIYNEDTIKHYSVISWKISNFPINVKSDLHISWSLSAALKRQRERGLLEYLLLAKNIGAVQPAGATWTMKTHLKTATLKVAGPG